MEANRFHPLLQEDLFRVASRHFLFFAQRFLEFERAMQNVGELMRADEAFNRTQEIGIGAEDHRRGERRDFENLRRFAVLFKTQMYRHKSPVDVAGQRRLAENFVFQFAAIEAFWAAEDNQQGATARNRRFVGGFQVMMPPD